MNESLDDMRARLAAEHGADWLADAEAEADRNNAHKRNLAEIADKHEAFMKPHRAHMAELDKREMLRETQGQLDELWAKLDAATQALAVAASSIDAIAALLVKSQAPKHQVAIRDHAGNITETISFPVARDE